MSKQGLEALFDQFPILQEGDVKLREMTGSDAEDIYAVFSDFEVVEHYDIGPLESTQQAEEMIDRWATRYADRSAIRWGIEYCHSGGIIGTVGLHIHSEWRAALGYDLARSYWRRGIMSAALAQVISFSFDAVELHRLEALVMPGNVASERLLERLGFVKEGLLREYMHFRGKHQDLNSYSLLRSDFES